MNFMIDIDDEKFKSEVLDSVMPVVVDVWAPWCNPCKAIEPVVQSLAEEYEGRVKFVRINADDNFSQAMYGITGIPTLLIFRNGKIADRIVGAAPRQVIESKIKPHIDYQAYA